MVLSKDSSPEGPPTTDGWTFAEDEVLRRWPYAVAGAEKTLGFGSVSIVLMLLDCEGHQLLVRCAS